MISISEFLLFTGSFLLVMFIFRERNGRRKDGLKYPPSLPSIPILGSTPFIKDFKKLPQLFLDKSYDLGPVFYVSFGSRRVLVLNNRNSIEDALVKHATSFSGRESSHMEKHIFKIDQKGFIFKNFGDEFKKFQRLTLSILRDFGFGATNLMETRILTEVNELIDHFRNLNGATFDPKEIIVLSVSNAPLNILLGRRTKYEDGMCEVCVKMKETVERAEPALFFFPLLRHIPPYRGRFAERIVHFKAVLEAVQKEINGSLRQGSDDSFVSRFIEREGPNYDRQQLLLTVRDFIVASTDTTATTMLWAFSFLADHPEVMGRVQEEIDAVVPKDRLPVSHDEPRMPFTQATILEIQRHRPAAPLAVPHLTLHDTEVLGYFVPKNTLTLVNIHAAHMNRIDWSDPDAFRPERFLDKDNNLSNKGQTIPFSLGRRSCPGESLARRQLFLFITGILQNFTICPPEGSESLNVQLISGFVLLPSPFQVRMIPRNA